MVIADDRIQPREMPELLCRARKGDAQSFCRLAQAHELRLFRQAVALARNPTHAEDLVAETMVEAWKSLAAYNEKCRFSTWLYAILLHRYQKSLRRARSRPVPLASLSSAEADLHKQQQQNLPASEGTPIETMLQNEMAEQMREAVEALSEKHRQVILLRFFEDASLSEMAVSLNCSVGTIKSRLHHALEKLHRMKITMNLTDSRRDT
jgi:RNA polymerase sigma-70 factor, ECF subfamily